MPKRPSPPRTSSITASPTQTARGLCSLMLIPSTRLCRRFSTPTTAPDPELCRQSERTRPERTDHLDFESGETVFLVQRFCGIVGQNIAVAPLAGDRAITPADRPWTSGNVIL